MLSYSFDSISENPLYLQLYNFIKNDILSGNLKTASKLPSKRAFAENLGVSVITVENAYEQLIAEGYIYSLPKKGFFVSDIEESNYGTLADVKVPGKNFLSELETDEEKTVRFQVDFSSNSILSSHFPYSVWSRVLRNCLIKYEKELLQSQPPAGCYALRKAVTDYLYSFRGMKVHPEQIIIGAGTEYLEGLLVQLLGQDKVYCVENPGYKKVYKVYSSNGAVVKWTSVSENGIDVKDLVKQQVDVLHISPGHQFPTGIITPVSKRQEILSWANEKNGRYIIEDDYDSEFRMTGVIIPTLQSIDSMGKVVYMNSFSKTMSSSIRVSYMVLPPELLKKYRENLSFYSCPVSSIVQFAIADFIEGGLFEKHINRLKNFYRRQRDYLVREIKNSGLSEISEIKRENAGLHFILQLNLKTEDSLFQKKLEEEGIRLRSLSEYCYGAENENAHCFVINYSSLTQEDIKSAVAKICRVAKSLN